jgi:arylsulfatase A-like enzyme
MVGLSRAVIKGVSLLIAVTHLPGHPGIADEPTSPRAQPSGARAARRPNILLIFTDDQSYKTVGCYPEALLGVTTPNIDALAADGIRFHGAYLGAWCMPSRATMLTGRLPHGVESMRMAEPYPASTYDPRQCPFWPKVLRANGYVTAKIGKWHTGVDAGTGRDWEWQIVWNRPKHPENAGNYYDNQILSFNGTEEKNVPGYSTDNYTRWAVDFIRGAHRDPGKPWYLWLCYGGVHGPTTPAGRHRGRHADDPAPVPADIFPPRPGKPDYLNRTQAWTRGADGRPVAGKSGEAFGDETGTKRKGYADFIHQVNDCAQSLDEGVGALIAALKETGQWEDTLVVFTADQGFGMGEHGFRTKLAPYDATYRSPLIVSMPGTFPRGKVAPHCVTGADLVVTFFALAGLELPWAMHGRDLTPLLKDPHAPWPHPAFYEFTGDHYGSDVTRVVSGAPRDAVYHDVPWYVALRDERWKYVRYLTPGETEELYDLRADPEELHNLADRPEHRAALGELRRRALAELRRTGAGFADELPPTKQMREGGP